MIAMKTVVQKILPHVGSCVSKATLLSGLQKMSDLVKTMNDKKGAKKQKIG